MARRKKEKNTCEIIIKRDFLRRLKKITTKGDCFRELKSALKKRNININDINLIKNN